MLSFNPDLRWSANDCLNSSFFNSVRRPELEITAPWKIKLKIDDGDSFDYENSKSMKYNKQDCIKMILHEVEEVRRIKQS
jgi:hypothetical protein